MRCSFKGGRRCEGCIAQIKTFYFSIILGVGNIVKLDVQESRGK